MTMHARAPVVPLLPQKALTAVSALPRIKTEKRKELLFKKADAFRSRHFGHTIRSSAGSEFDVFFTVI
jgi:hypothetical protein